MKTTKDNITQQTNKNVHQGHRERMRERLENGQLDSYQTHEILEMVLYQTHKTRNTNDIAHALLKKFGSLTGVLEADISDLMTVNGVGKQTATTIKNYALVFRRYKQEKLEDKKKIVTFNDVFEYVTSLLEDNSQEEFMAVCLDGGHNIVAVKTWQGTQNRVNVTVREIVIFCLKNKAVGAVVAHCHPNGSPKPSMEDLRFTKLLYTALKSVDITLGEHIIVGSCGKFYSFNKNYRLEDYLNIFKQQYNPLGLICDKNFAIDGEYTVGNCILD